MGHQALVELAAERALRPWLVTVMSGLRLDMAAKCRQHLLVDHDAVIHH